MASPAGTPDAFRAPPAAPPPRSSAAPDPNPAAPRAAKAPHRSSAEPSPPTPPGNPPGSVICKWQRGDILIGRLQILNRHNLFWKIQVREAKDQFSASVAAFAVGEVWPTHSNPFGAPVIATEGK